MGKVGHHQQQIMQVINPIENLPIEMFVTILGNMSAQELDNARGVSRTWRAIIDGSQLLTKRLAYRLDRLQSFTGHAVLRWQFDGKPVLPAQLHLPEFYLFSVDTCLRALSEPYAIARRDRLRCLKIGYQRANAAELFAVDEVAFLGHLSSFINLQPVINSRIVHPTAIRNLCVDPQSLRANSLA